MKEKFPHDRKSSHSLGQWGTLESQKALPKEKKKKTTIEFMKTAVTAEKQLSCSQPPAVSGAGHGGMGYINGPQGKDQAWMP